MIKHLKPIETNTWKWKTNNWNTIIIHDTNIDT